MTVLVRAERGETRFSGTHEWEALPVRPIQDASGPNASGATFRT